MQVQLASSTISVFVVIYIYKYYILLKAFENCSVSVWFSEVIIVVFFFFLKIKIKCQNTLICNVTESKKKKSWILPLIWICTKT